MQWVAHRGYPQRYPENSLPGFAAALHAGARFLEFDIQLSLDGVPMVFHDEELERLTGHPLRIFDLPAAKLHTLPLLWQDQSAQQTAEPCIPTLADLFTLLQTYPHTRVFIELKSASIEHVGINRYLDYLLPVLMDCPVPLVLISFSTHILSAIVARSSHAVGWIIPEWNTQHQAIARNQQPDWLFCNLKRYPAGATPWPGPWHWCFYVINDSATARQLMEKGIGYFETDCIAEMLHGQD